MRIKWGKEKEDKFLMFVKNIITNKEINYPLKATLWSNFYKKLKLWRWRILQSNHQTIHPCCIIKHAELLRQINHIAPSERTSYASEISLNFFSASSLLLGFLSGCHFKACFLYLCNRHCDVSLYHRYYTYYNFRDKTQDTATNTGTKKWKRLTH